MSASLQNYFTHTNGGYYDIHRNFDAAPEVNGTYATALWRQEALLILEQHNLERGADPLFLYMAFNAIHDTLSVPASFQETETYANITTQVVFDKRQLAAGAMYIADEAIGAIIQKMQELGMYQNSVLVVASDNGGSVSDGGNNWPLRGAKKDYYQGGIRVPGFVHSPFLSKAGRSGVTYDHLVHVSDWMPTLVGGAARIDLSSYDLDGYNHWPSFFDDSIDGPRKEVLHNIDYLNGDDSSYLAPHETIAAITSYVAGGLYKMILNDRGNSGGMWYEVSTNNGVNLEGPREQWGTTMENETRFIFDLLNDPTETINLYDHDGFSHVKEQLVNRLCFFWTDRMTDAMYHDSVQSPHKKIVVEIFEAEGNFITYWNSSKPDLVPQYPIADNPHATSDCPFSSMMDDSSSRSKKEWAAQLHH